MGTEVTLSEEDQALRDTVLAPHRRWVIRHKVAVVEAVARGIVTREELQVVQGISAEELVSWTQLMNQFGHAGLRSTRYQVYRDAEAGRTTTRRVSSAR